MITVYESDHWSIGKFERLLQLVLLRLRDPQALFGCMFLDIFAVSGPIFLQANFTSSCKIVHFIKSDNQFPSISRNNQIAEAPSHPLLNLPFNHTWFRWPLKIFFIIVEVQFKKVVELDVCAVSWCPQGSINSQEYKSFEIHTVTIKISMTEYRHRINCQTYGLF